LPKTIGHFAKISQELFSWMLEFVLAIMGILCNLIISGRLYRLKEISLLPKNLGTFGKIRMLEKNSNKKFLGCLRRFRQFWNLSAQ
jgi:hypothetical protein